MGSLREISTGRTILLEPEHFIGRAFTSALRLEPTYVSAQHALLRYTGQHWDLRDLASRNGTFLDRQLIRPGEEHALRKGARIAFGDLEAEWELVDDAAPPVMVVPLDGGAPIVIQGDLLALPSAEDPRTTIYRGVGALWLLEQPDAAPVPLHDLEVFQTAGRSFRFCCADNMCATVRYEQSPIERQVRNLTLSFVVSLDEEHVTLTMICGGRATELGERAHNYLLLTLARRREEDLRKGLSEASAGWTDQEDLRRDRRMSLGQISVDVFRMRRQLADNGVVDAASIIERRPGQLRIASCKFTIVRR